MLTINCVILCPPLVLDILNFSVGADRGARGLGAGTERGDIEIGWSAERVFRRSIMLTVLHFDVWYVGSLWVHSSSYLSWCIKRVRAISRLDNARYALSGLVIARSQAVERAFIEKGCTLHGLKEALHRAVSDKREFYAASFSSRSRRRDAVVAHTRCLYRQQRDNLPD